jgi:hypothetical protein
MRGSNIRHGQKRRKPWSRRNPIAIISVELAVLGWLGVELAKALS